MTRNWAWDRWQILLVLFVLFVAGCSERKHEPGPKVESFPVTGTVSVAGQPAAGARVFFHPTPYQPRQRVFDAFTGEGGQFQPTTNTPGDGLPPGKYIVTITWPEIPTDDPELERDKLRGRYNNPKRPVFTVEVKAEANNLKPFELK
jgi:hypothetical protein